ncbi:MAG: glycosyltransferase [Polyangia bacterium]
MFDIQIDRSRSVVTFVLKGTVTPEEMERFGNDFRRACEAVKGDEFVVKGDVRGFGPTGPEVVQQQSGAYQNAFDLGARRFAEIVENDELAREANNLARANGSDELLRRFADADAAERWLQSDG